MKSDLALLVKEQRAVLLAERAYSDAIDALVRAKFPTPAYSRASDELERARVALSIAEARLEYSKSALAGKRHLRVA